MFTRISALLYGLICYLVFFATLLYMIGFIANLIVPKSIDSAADGSIISAVLIDLCLIGIFAVQHSVMAREWFKKAWTRVIPEPVERSTYVLFASLALMLLFWLWQPIGGVIWTIENPTIRSIVVGLSVTGWLTVLISTFVINHFDLFGLRQVYFYFSGRSYSSLGFRTPGPYRLVRHPLYFGLLVAFWAAPVMTSAHLVFAIATTVYVLTAIQFEERDLTRFFGEAYQRYRKQVPMIIPFKFGKTNPDTFSLGEEPN